MTQTTSASIALLLTSVLCAGCTSPPAAQTKSADTTAPAGNGQTPGNGQTAGQRAAGTVVEVIEAPPYTYVRVDTGTESIWAAANQFEVKVGERVVVPLDMPMANFHSSALDRDFPLVYFTEAVLREGEEGRPALPPGHPKMDRTGKDTAVASSEPVATAPDGLAIAAVWADKSTLAGKTVTVRGRVVKVNNGILGQNWLHLQDGSGSADAGTNDLTVTSDDTASVGDIVTVTGVVEVDKDFGAGYAYPVILTKAAVRKS